MLSSRCARQTGSARNTLRWIVDANNRSATQAAPWPLMELFQHPSSGSCCNDQLGVLCTVCPLFHCGSRQPVRLPASLLSLLFGRLKHNRLAPWTPPERPAAPMLLAGGGGYRQTVCEVILLDSRSLCWKCGLQDERLLTRCVGDVSGSRRQAGRYSDLFQCHTAFLRQTRTTTTSEVVCSWKITAFVWYGLNVFTSARSAWSPPTSVPPASDTSVRYHRKAAGGGGRHHRPWRPGSRVQTRMVVWSAMSLIQAHMSTNLLDDITRRLIRLEVFPGLLANGSMPVIVFCTPSLPCLAIGYERSAYRRGFGGVGRYLVNRTGHLVFTPPRRQQFPAPDARRLADALPRALGFLSSGGYLQGGFVNGLYQGAQWVDGEVMESAMAL